MLTTKLMDHPWQAGEKQQLVGGFEPFPDSIRLPYHWADTMYLQLSNVFLFYQTLSAPPWSSGSVLDHRSLPPGFESRRGHIWRLFHLRLRFITFGGRSAHLAYHVHKSGRKTSIIIIYQTLKNVNRMQILRCRNIEKYLFMKLIQSQQMWPIKDQ